MKRLLLIFICAISSMLLSNVGFSATESASGAVGGRQAGLSYRQTDSKRVQTLVGAYDDAYKNDPTLREQIATYRESLQGVAESRSVLLPQVDFNTNTSETSQNGEISGSNTYNSGSYSISVSQVVFNAAAYKQLVQSKAAVRAAAMLLSAQTQDLIIRVASAYFAVLQANDILNYTKEQQRFVWKQLWATKERFRLGHATVTDIDQAQGQYDLIRAEHVTARVDLYNRMQDLSQITSIRYAKLATLKRKFPLVSPIPKRLDTWLAVARKQNLFLQAAQLDLHASHEAVRVAKAGYWPTMNFVGSYSNSNSLTSVGGGGQQREQDVKSFNYGLDLNWSAFQSGLTVSQVKRAVAAYERSYALLNQQYLAAMANARRSYVGVLDGGARVARGREALKSNRSALLNSEEGFKAGTQTVFDVLQAQNRLFDAEKQYARDVYTYLLDTLLLKQAAGTLSPNNLLQLQTWFQTKRPAKRVSGKINQLEMAVIPPGHKAKYTRTQKKRITRKRKRSYKKISKKEKAKKKTLKTVNEPTQSTTPVKPTVQPTYTPQQTPGVESDAKKHESKKLDAVTDEDSGSSLPPQYRSPTKTPAHHLGPVVPKNGHKPWEHSIKKLHQHKQEGRDVSNVQFKKVSSINDQTSLSQLHSGKKKALLLWGEKNTHTRHAKKPVTFKKISYAHYVKKRLTFKKLKAKTKQQHVRSKWVRYSHYTSSRLRKLKIKAETHQRHVKRKAIKKKYTDKKHHARKHHAKKHHAKKHHSKKHHAKKLNQHKRYKQYAKHIKKDVRRMNEKLNKPSFVWKVKLNNKQKPENAWWNQSDASINKG